MQKQQPKLLDQLRNAIRYKHYSLATEKAYVYWVRFYIRFHKLRHPNQLGKTEVEQFLKFLTTERSVSASTHRQALSAILFLYKEVQNVFQNLECENLLISILKLHLHLQKTKKIWEQDVITTTLKHIDDIFKRQLLKQEYTSPLDALG